MRIEKCAFYVLQYKYGDDVMQRYFAIQKVDNSMILEESDWYHIRRVMRMNDGDKVEVVFESKLYICKICDVNDMSSLSIVSEETVLDDFMPQVTLIVPLLKEQKLDFIFQKSTELGVSQIIVVPMERTVVKLDEKKDKKLLRWNRICKEASEQSKRCQVPEVRFFTNLTELDCLSGLRLVCSTVETEKNVKKLLQSKIKYDKLNIVVGPEGGLSIKEEEYLKQIGFIPVTLGKRIMRAETVPLFVLSVLNYEYME